MSVIGEVVGVIACVAGVISAYHDGGAIIQKLKQKRAAKRAPAPPRLLEESIDQAPEEIEREKERGVKRFGKHFEAGDHIAVIALQQITIQLQSSLLDKLKKDDETTDFMFLVDAADTGRDQTISALFELRQRLLAAQSITEIGPPQQQQQKRVSSIARELPVRSAIEPAPIPIKERKPTWTQPAYSVSSPSRIVAEEDATSGADSPGGTSTPSGRKRHSSLFGIFRHHRSHSGSNEVHEVTESPASPTSAPFTVPLYSPPTRYEPRAHAEPQNRPEPQSQQPAFTYQEWEDDPAQIWGSSSKPTPSPAERRSTVISEDLPPDVGPALPVPARTQSYASGGSGPSTITPSNFAAHASSNNVPTPTPENSYLGFCKSAWKLQNGDRKAMQKCKEFNDGWSQSSVYYLSCASSKCAFAGHINIDKIWDKVWPVQSKGVKFRWPFLAKSHIPQQKVKDHQYVFQCLFCVFQGEKSPVYAGTDTYLDHVATTHRGQELSDVVLYKTKCIADREAEDGDDFDINLFPLSAGEQLARRKSSVLPDELLGLSAPGKDSTDKQDSVFSNEPWNAGLSEFHYGGEMERTELE